MLIYLEQIALQCGWGAVKSTHPEHTRDDLACGWTWSYKSLTRIAQIATMYRMKEHNRQRRKTRIQMWKYVLLSTELSTTYFATRLSSFPPQQLFEDDAVISLEYWRSLQDIVEWYKICTKYKKLELAISQTFDVWMIVNRKFLEQLRDPSWNGSWVSFPHG